MRKITILFLVILFTNAAFAGGGWASSAISISKDGTSYNYMLNNEGWTNGTWGSNTLFNGYDFGTPLTLVLNGGSGNGWTDDTPGYNTTSFVLYYRVYKTGNTPGTWSSVNLDFQAYASGNNRIFDKSDATIDLMALATDNGTNSYTVEVAMSKNQFYSGGNWNSMVPGGQSVGYSSATAGYTATFTKTNTATAIQNTTSNTIIIGKKGALTVTSDTLTKVEIYTLSGLRISASEVKGKFEQALGAGTYIVKANGKASVIIVQ